MTTSRCHRYARVCHCRGSLRLILVARTDSRDRESAMPPGRRLLGVGSALRVCGARSGPARPSPGQGRIRVASESSPAAAARVTLPMTSHGGGHHHDSVTGRRTRHSRPGARAHHGRALSRLAVRACGMCLRIMMVSTLEPPPSPILVHAQRDSLTSQRRFRSR
jgi:hypothetical protein